MSTLIGIILIIILLWGVAGAIFVSTSPVHECVKSIGPLCYAWKEKSVTKTIVDMLWPF